MSLSAFIHCWGGWDIWGGGGATCKNLESICVSFFSEGRNSTHRYLFLLLNYTREPVSTQPQQGDCSTHGWTHTLTHEHTDAQTNLCLRCKHVRLHTRDVVHWWDKSTSNNSTHASSSCPHTSPPSLFNPHWSHSDSCLTLTGNLGTCFYFPRCCSEEGAGAFDRTVECWFYCLWPSLTPAETIARWTTLPCRPEGADWYLCL